MDEKEKYLSENFSIWKHLTEDERTLLANSLVLKRFKKDEFIKNLDTACDGLYIIVKGQARAYIISDEGKELTLYRLLNNDICLFSAACMMKDIMFDIYVQAQLDTEAYLIPANVYQKLLNNSVTISNYINGIMGSKFSEVMWLVDQIMFKSFDKRLAEFLLEESRLCDSDIIYITHEKIANHLGSAREVVSRMVKFFQNEGIVKSERGVIKIIDKEKLLRI